MPPKILTTNFRLIIPVLFLSGLMIGASLSMIITHSHNNWMPTFSFMELCLTIMFLLCLVSTLMTTIATYHLYNRPNPTPSINEESRDALLQLKNPMPNVYTATENIHKLFLLKEFSTAWNIEGDKNQLNYELENCLHSFQQFGLTILKYGYSLTENENTKVYDIQKAINFSSNIIKKYIRNHRQIDQAIANKAIERLHERTMELKDFENQLNEKLIQLSQ